MKYSTILFDLDGVLITQAMQFSDRLEEIWGIPVARLQPFFTGVFLECGIGKADLKEELAKVIGEWGWQGSIDELLAFWFSTGTEIDQEVAGFVRELRRQGIKTYLTTDQEKYRGEYLRRMLGNGVLFDEVFYSAEIGCRKKDRAFFAYVEKHINANREQVLFIDDGEKNVETAKAFGYDAFLFTRLDGLKLFLSYETLTEKLCHAREEVGVRQIIAEGDAAFKAGKTIQARSVSELMRKAKKMDNV